MSSIPPLIQHPASLDADRPGASFASLTLVEGLALLASIAGVWVLMTMVWAGLDAESGELTRLISNEELRVITTSLAAAIAAAVVSWAAYGTRVRTLAKRNNRTMDFLTASERIVESALQHMPVGIVIIDEQLRVLYANDTATRLHGRPFILGEICYESICAKGQQCQGCPAHTTFETGEPAHYMGFRSHVSSDEIVREQTHPLDMPDGTRLSIVVHSVVTEEYRLQASVIHQEKMAATGLLAAGIAHDMGNPISAIQMHMQLMAEDAPEDSKDSIATVRREVDRLARTLRELVDFSRRRRTEEKLVALRSVVDDAMRLMRYDNRMRKVTVEIEEDADMPPVKIVEDHLMQVVMNLVINAVDSMPDGGKLRFELRAIGESVVLRLHDSGQGMSREVLERCLEPMFTTKGEGKGTGLGLSMSRDSLVARGGTLELHSTPGKGTTVVATLPAAAQRQSPMRVIGEPVRRPHHGA